MIAEANHVPNITQGNNMTECSKGKEKLTREDESRDTGTDAESDASADEGLAEADLACANALGDNTNADVDQHNEEINTKVLFPISFHPISHTSFP